MRKSLRRKVIDAIEWPKILLFTQTLLQGKIATLGELILYRVEGSSRDYYRRNSKEC